MVNVRVLDKITCKILDKKAVIVKKNLLIVQIRYDSSIFSFGSVNIFKNGV